jgi:alanine dehydrogenase
MILLQDMIFKVGWEGCVKMKTLPEIHDATVLSEKDIETILSKIGWTSLIDRIAEGFRRHAKGEIDCPPKTIMEIPTHQNDYRVMPAYSSKYPDFCGTKIIAACPCNPADHNLPLAMGIYILNNARTHEVLMISPANLLTAYRTAAASAVAVRELSKEDSQTLGVIGCGQQAVFHIPAISAVRDISEVLISDIDEQAVDLLCKDFECMPIEKALPKQIFHRADIIATLTPTTKPHIFVSDFPDRDVMICAVGGDSESKMEIDPSVMKIVDHFCDGYEQASHTGTILSAIKKGFIKKEDLKSLGSFMIGQSHFDEQKKVKAFFSTGCAWEDLLTAILLYENRDVLEDKELHEPAFRHVA